MQPGESRPKLDYRKYGPRTRWTNIGLFQFGFEWKRAGLSIVEAMRTTIFPTVIYAIVANGVFLVISSGTGQITSFALIAAGYVLGVYHRPLSVYILTSLLY